MSAFAKLFGGVKSKQPPSKEVIEKLKENHSMLEKKSEYLEKKIQDELADAKRHGTQNKRLALAALKKKKRYEKQLGQVDGTLSNLDLQIESLENAQANTEIFKNMQYGAKALKSVHGNMTADDVHNVMDDIAEQQDVALEISDALSNPVGFGTEIDDDELLLELEELEQEDLDKELPVLDIEASKLPDVPTSDLPTLAASVQEDDAELRELKSWMAS